MAIEIRQLLIKTNVLPASEDERTEPAHDVQALKQDLLVEVRRLVLEILDERGRR